MFLFNTHLLANNQEKEKPSVEVVKMYGLHEDEKNSPDCAYGNPLLI
jgi:hypothetical protein